MTTLFKRSGRTGTAMLAIVTSFLVVLSGLFVVPAANAAPAPTIHMTEAPRDGAPSR
ncbi:MAG: hypothetical protein ACTIJ6_02190 [Leucobacter sp.]